MTTTTMTTTMTMMTTTTTIEPRDLMLPPNEEDIVATNKCVGILAFELTADVFLGLFHCNVHEAVEASENA
jgi:hypothetical protein